MNVFVYLALLVLCIDLLFVAYLYSVWFYAAAVVPLVIGALYFRMRQRQKTTLPYETGWQLGAALDLSDEHTTQQVNNAVLSIKAINLGILAIGGPGSGKTESVALAFFSALPTALPGSGLAFFEGKGDIDIYKKAVAAGRSPDYFFSSELPGSDTINLMAGEALDVEDRLTKMLIGHTSTTSYYSDAQRAVLKFVVPMLVGCRQPVNLRDLYAVLTVPEAQAELLMLARERDVDPTMLSLFTVWLERKPQDRRQELSGLLNKLMEFCVGPIADRINAYQPDISVNDVVVNNKFIYFHLPLSETTRAVAIALVEMFGVEARRRQLSGPEQYKMFPLLMDDWGAFFHQNFGPISARCRSAMMPLIFSFQSLAQIKGVSDNFARELDDNLATKIIFRVNGEDTAQFAINLLGEHQEASVGASQMGGRDGASFGLTGRARINSRDLRELLPGECYISTVMPRDGKMLNPLWRLRIPKAPYTDAALAQVQMPTAKVHPMGKGLDLWEKYMNPNAVKTFEIPGEEGFESVEAPRRVVEL